MKTLNLNLKRQWFDMFLIGEKTEEYREIKPSFCARFLLVDGKRYTSSTWKEYLIRWSVDDIKNCLMEGLMTWRHYCTITFPNGMTPPIPQIEIEFKGFEIREGNPKWGAVEGVEYFVLKTGNIISKVNCKKI